MTVSGFRPIEIPLLHRIPILGGSVFTQSPLTYITFALVFGVWVMLYRTRLGLALQAVGDHPKMADAAGLSVAKLRYLGVLASGAFSGCAGVSDADRGQCLPRQHDLREGFHSPGDSDLRRFGTRPGRCGAALHLSVQRTQQNCRCRRRGYRGCSVFPICSRPYLLTDHRGFSRALQRRTQPSAPGCFRRAVMRFMQAAAVEFPGPARSGQRALLLPAQARTHDTVASHRPDGGADPVPVATKARPNGHRHSIQ